MMRWAQDKNTLPKKKEEKKTEIKKCIKCNYLINLINNVHIHMNHPIKTENKTTLIEVKLFLNLYIILMHKYLM